MKVSDMDLIWIKIIALILLVALAWTFSYANPNRFKIGSPRPRCQVQDAKYLDTTLPVSERVADLLGRMSQEEKIGQITLVEKNSIDNIKIISKYNLGGLLSGFGAKPDPNTPAGWQEMIKQYQDETKNTCLQIPILYGVDAIHGFSNVEGATVFPHFIGLGAARDPELVKKVAAATTAEMAATGVYWTFAPNVDVASDPRWGRTFETFGSDSSNVSNLGLSYVEGVQTQGLATLKHFIGTGAMEWGSSTNKDFQIDQGNVGLGEQQLRQEHLAPFANSINGGARVIMVGLNNLADQKMSANKYWLTDVLKNELKFSGIVVSDWYGVYEISNNHYDAAVIAINAGVDMIMLPYDYHNFQINMKRALANGDISRERLDEAVARILTVKFELGLFDRPTPTKDDLAVIGNSAHRELAREAVRKSQVLLKNQNQALPLSTNSKRILVAGSGADNLGRQSGGWTIEWQGVEGNSLSGTTILSAIENSVSKETQVEYNQMGNFPPADELAEIGIAVVAEKPYAEGWGDNANPQLSAEDLAAIEKLRLLSKKLIVVIISGRPLEISPYINNWDGVVASWLPGSEGQGVADVLFGSYPFTGKLPIEWIY